MLLVYSQVRKAEETAMGGGRICYQYSLMRPGGILDIFKWKRGKKSRREMQESKDERSVRLDMLNDRLISMGSHALVCQMSEVRK